MFTIAVDFDDTLIREDENGRPQALPGAAEAMERLQRSGYRIVIHSCRITEALERGDLARTVRRMAELLHTAGIVFDEIWTGPKMIAHVYVDDRAVGFRGDWSRTIEDIGRRVAKYTDRDD